MAELTRLLVPVAVALVVLVLILGLRNLARHGGAGRSQKLMRWRLILQLLAVILIIVVIYTQAS